MDWGPFLYNYSAARSIYAAIHGIFFEKSKKYLKKPVKSGSLHKSAKISRPRA